MRVTNKYFIQLLAEIFDVHPRVITDVVKNRGAYQRVGYGKQGKQWLRLQLQIEWLEKKIQATKKVTDKRQPGT